MDVSSVAEPLKNQGNAALKAGDIAKAISFYSQAIEIDPQNFICFTNRSMASFKLGRFTDSLKDADRAIELNPSWMKGHARRAAALSSLAKWDQAIKSYNNALKLEPNSAELKVQLEEAQRQQQESEKQEWMNDFNSDEDESAPVKGAKFSGGSGGGGGGDGDFQIPTTKPDAPKRVKIDSSPNFIKPTQPVPTFPSKHSNPSKPSIVSQKPPPPPESGDISRAVDLISRAKLTSLRSTFQNVVRHFPNTANFIVSQLETFEDASSDEEGTGKGHRGWGDLGGGGDDFDEDEDDPFARGKGKGKGKSKGNFQGKGKPSKRARGGRYNCSGEDSDDFDDSE
eukprot:c8267_g1_i2.p1 GENE.c8267_g1_i2~~c8267_g1_i2.p1  ORF type:complete len:352 (+),score=84.52 c8267_g1_i2:38-1057(+)